MHLKRSWLLSFFLSMGLISLASHGGTTPSVLRAIPASAGLNQPLQARSRLTTIAFSPDRKTIAAVGSDNGITLWDLASSRRRGGLPDQGGEVTAVAFDPSGDTLAAILGDNRITLWNAATGAERLTLFPGRLGGTVSTVALSPDGNTLASVGNDTRVIVWDMTTGAAKLLTHSDIVTDVAFSSDGRSLASASRDSSVTLWDPTTGTKRAVLPSAGNGSISQIAFSRNGKVLAGVAEDGRIILWNPLRGEIRRTLTGAADRVTQAVLSPRGGLLASVGGDTSIKLWDVATGRVRSTLGNQPGIPVNGVAFSRNGRIVASATDDPRVMLWDAKTGHVRRILTGHAGPVATVAFGPDGRMLASVGKDGEIIVWDVATGEERSRSRGVGPLVASLGTSPAGASAMGSPRTTVPTAPGQLAQNDSGTTATPENDAQSQPPSPPDVSASPQAGTNAAPRPGRTTRHVFNKRGVTALAVSPDGALIASAGEDGRVRLWDTAGRQRLSVQDRVGALISGVVFSADGKRLLSVGRDTVIRSWDVASGRQTLELRGHEHPIRAVAASADGRFVASAGEETRILLWDAMTGKLTKALSGHRDFVNAVAFSPAGAQLASGGADARIIIWDVEDGKPAQTFVGHSGEVNTVAYSPNGRLLASAGEDSEVFVWDVATGRRVLSLSGHQAPVRTLTFSADGQTLASAGEDTRILVWDVTSGNLRRAVTGATGFINALVFRTSGRVLAGSDDDKITEWDAASGARIRTIDVPAQPVAGDSSEAGSDAAASTEPGSSLLDVVARVLGWLVPEAAAQGLPDPNQGPGGPVLVITSGASTFGKYYAEILRTEGLNAFAVADIGTVTPASLPAYDVVILAPMTLSATQVTTLTNWVSAGGNLIAMRPDPQLASLLGVVPAGSTLSNGYLLVDTSQAPGQGIVGTTMQFHGTANRYTLSGATSLATLYTDAVTATSNPAVTLRSVGANGGQAAAFAYDLATSVVYTRQGNPAWAAQERDGSTPIRSDDKFFGDAAGDPQPDWVDLENNVAVPQADEQQRLLANLMLLMEIDRKPLPRFWYFPRGKKAVVIMTGDDHGNGGTVGRFNQFIAASPPGCSVANWECVRGTSYMFVQTQNVTPAQAASFNAQGFEVGLHLNTNCGNYTPTSLNTFYNQQVSAFTSAYPTIPAPVTQRHHCIAWSDWITGAKTELQYGMRLDTNYYFWPPSWAQDRPGLFTGSAMPMRFADLDGTLIDVYHAATQMTDESGQTYPFTIDTLLDRAIGAEGYYGAYTVNAHTDLPQMPESDAVLSSALARGVPIVSSRQMLTWLDARNSSSFGTIAWNANALSFTIAPASGANGLQAMVPRQSTAGTLSSITGPGGAVPFTTSVVKGVDYAFIAAAAGTYTVTYGAGATTTTVIGPTTTTSTTSTSSTTSSSTTTSIAGTTTTSSTTTTTIAGGGCASPANPIVAENCLTGNPSSEWDVSGVGDTSIQGFATDISVNRGSTVSFKVKTSASNYRLDIYRMGYYGGMGARKVATVTPSVSLPQTQPACLTSAATGLIDCGNWAVSASWAVPANATSGIYFARVVRTDNGGASHIVFVVRDDASTSSILFQTSDSTWQAYNDYGGNSLYSGSPVGRAYKVSYNRPFSTRVFEPESWVFNGEYPMVRWLERNGYDVAYFTGVDADRNGALIENHRMWISNGHDEYWSGAQRANVEAARAAGVHLAFLSGNKIFWKTRWEAAIDGSGTPYRTLVCYKETHANAIIDPQDPPTWTGTWRDPRFSPPADGGRPENALGGSLFRINGLFNDAIQVPAADGKMRFWRNTTVATLGAGQTATLAPGTLGAEVDVDEDNGFRPAGLFGLSTNAINTGSLYLLDNGSTFGAGNATHRLTLYRHSSGALVFSAGSYQWSWGLDANHDRSSFGSTTDVRMQQATVNLLGDMGVQPGTLQAGLVGATASTDTTAPSSTITSPTAGSTVTPGNPVTITGTATDSGGVVGGVEVSVDGGATWHPASGRATWTYSWTPSGSGSVTLKSRSVDDSGNIETPGAGITVTVGTGSPTTTSTSTTTSTTVPSGGCAGTSIWAPTATPTSPTDPDTVAVELGVKFRSDVSGFICGLRFYKGSSQNGGTHVGSLWTTGGTKLGSATFTGETASGWQQVTFATPIAIAANTVYVASYHAPTGRYAGDDNYFATAGVDNGSLHALQNGVSGGNGVYAYGASGFPNNTYASSNYWVDIVFSPTTPTTTTSSTTTSSSTLPPTTTSTSTTSTSSTTTSTLPPTTTTSSTTTSSSTLPPTTTSTSTTSTSSTTTSTLPPTTTTSSTTTSSSTLPPTTTSTSTTSTSSTTTTTVPSGTCTGNSIWAPTATPANPIDPDTAAVELGVKFRADVSGTICGLRFYKGGTQNGGIHVGRVWTSDGQLLASATFTNETTSGWQQVNFATPVQIAANTIYVASYNAPQGRYAGDDNYFANAGVDNGPLHALQNGVSAGNGVYLYGTGGFPTNSYLSSNYWVDVVFSADVAPPATAINDLFLFQSGTLRTVNYTGPLGMGVLANDTDPGNQPLSAVVVGTLPTGVTLASNGVVTINRTSAALFNYRTNNGTQLSQPATGASVTLAIDGAPTAVVENCTYTRAGAGSVSGAACAMVGTSTFTMNLKANDTDPNSATNVPVDGVGRTVTGANVTATGTGVSVSANAACGQAAIAKTASSATVTNNCDGTVRVVVSAGAPASPITLTYGAIDDLGVPSATANRTTDTLTVQ